MDKKPFPTNPFFVRILKTVIPISFLGFVLAVHFILKSKGLPPGLYFGVAILMFVGVIEVLLLIKIAKKAMCPQCGQEMSRVISAKSFLCQSCNVEWLVPLRRRL